ncbi:MAG TPA: PASTA domain-containing protein [Candidatus Limnocylindrales bacterium]|nr:PASTA domain-containing protein [Candidatus Limnocylindrales bacterium]
MSRRRRRPVEPWRQRALAQREAERARTTVPEGDAPAESAAPVSAPARSWPPAPPRGVSTERAPVAIDTLSPEVTAPPRRERRRGPRFNLLTGTLLLSAIALIGGFLIVNTVLMPSFTHQGSEVRVPEVIGLSEREAERSLAALDLRLSKISEQWSADVPRGFITMQEPPPGGVVKRGRRISVVVSLGAQGTSVPVLDGSTERQAGILLESAGLRRGKVARVYTDEVGRDLVIATDPPGETVVEQETVVDLLVSLGTPPRGYVLPDFTGRDLNGVARGLRDEGFLVSAREGGPRQRSDAVAAQNPPPGHRVEPRDSVVLYYHP